MRARLHVAGIAVLGVLIAVDPGISAEPSAVPLPQGVKAVWDLNAAYHETTPTRERICINGLWRWQPAEMKSDQPPTANWGYFKVPGCWPGITDYMQKDSQTVYAHPSWKGEPLRGVTAAWHEREITIPNNWAGRRISLATDYLNSFAAVYVDGKKVGEMQFPSGEVDLTAACPAGSKHVLSLLVAAVSRSRELTPLTYDKSAERRRASIPRARPVRRRLSRRHAGGAADRRREGGPVGA